MRYISVFVAYYCDILLTQSVRHQCKALFNNIVLIAKSLETISKGKCVIINYILFIISTCMGNTHLLLKHLSWVFVAMLITCTKKSLMIDLFISTYTVSQVQQYSFVCVAHVSNFSHVLLLLVQVSLIMFLCYGLYVDVPLPFSQLVSLGSNSEQD